MVRGEVLLSDAETGEELAVIECSSVTVAADGRRRGGLGPGPGVGGRGVRRDHRLRRERRLGGPLPGGRRLRARESAPIRASIRAEALAEELGWRAGDRGEAAAQDIVVTVTPGEELVILARDLTPGQHLAVLGADAHGKQEVDLDAIEALQDLLRRVGAGERGRRARQRCGCRIDRVRGREPAR